MAPFPSSRPSLPRTLHRYFYSPIAAVIMSNLSLYSVKAVLILDAEGNRLLAKYYPHATELAAVKDQRAFEKSLFDKTRRTNGRRRRHGSMHGGGPGVLTLFATPSGDHAARWPRCMLSQRR